jgi:hypothetical protein
MQRNMSLGRRRVIAAAEEEIFFYFPGVPPA